MDRNVDWFHLTMCFVFFWLGFAIAAVLL